MLVFWFGVLGVEGLDYFTKIGKPQALWTGSVAGVRAHLGGREPSRPCGHLPQVQQEREGFDTDHRYPEGPYTLLLWN